MAGIYFVLDISGTNLGVANLHYKVDQLMLELRCSKVVTISKLRKLLLAGTLRRDLDQTLQENVGGWTSEPDSSPPSDVDPLSCGEDYFLSLINNTEISSLSKLFSRTPGVLLGRQIGWMPSLNSTSVSNFSTAISLSKVLERITLTCLLYI